MSVARSTLRSGGLPRILTVLLGTAAAVVTVGGIHAARGILGPTFLALVLTIVVHPVRQRLARRLPDWLATTICVALVYLIIVGLALSIVVAIARFGALIPTYADDADELVNNVTSRLHDLGVDADAVHKIGSSFDLSQLADLVAGVLSGIAGLASSLFFLLTLCLFVTLDGGAFPDRLREAAATRPRLVEALSGFAVGTRRYLLVSTVFGAIVAVLDTIALYLLGVPLPLLWGLLAFLTNYIPNIGFVIGLVPPAVLALLDSGAGLMLAVIAVYCVLNLIIQSGIQPKVVGDSVGLSTTLTFLSLVFWSWIIGPVGAILAVPLSLLVRALLVDADPAIRWLTPVIANRGEEPPEPTPQTVSRPES
ncbi:AI-2E family transporter [Nocardioides sp. CER19]|uniref:AI-2E family transporter n=1 Tax=Nocardioides sp. CER19 TaxID=3038538 RepID=UPI00244AE530|nr:AI-2E family transporter [Nocardioides sp. CER19]MDH2416003.1 AI-2E family transporter [Nocardioides sp. CER19]